MPLSSILAIAGKPGLYRVVHQGSTRVIVEALLTKRRMGISAYSAASKLSDTAIFLRDGEAPLPEVFTSMLPFEEEIKALKIKQDREGVQALFKRVLPEYSPTRVHVGDMQRAFKWFLLLREAGFTQFVADEKENQENLTEEPTPEAPSTEETKDKA